MTTSNIKPGRFIKSGPRTGVENMVTDEYLMRRCAREGTPFLRTYAWKQPTLSLGYFQIAGKVADRGFCLEQGVDMVRRPTGGGAILHHREMTFSIALPDSHEALKGPVMDSYFDLGRPLLSLLNSWGMPVKFRHEGPRLKAENCFAGRAETDMVLDGLKVYGAAQRRIKGAVMMHGSLLLGVDLELWERVFKINRMDGYRGLAPLFTPAHEKEWDSSLKKAYEQGLGLELEEHVLSSREMAEIVFVAKERATLVW